MDERKLVAPSELATSKQQADRLSRIMRAASVFAEKRYGTRGIHIGTVSDFLIDKTDVGEYIKELNNRETGSSQPELLEMRLGDPTADQYEGIGPYSGYDRHSSRFKNFNPASSYAGYLIPGDEQLKARFRIGRSKTPGYIHPPGHMEVFITGGVAGALRLVSTALVLPPDDHKPDQSILDDMENRSSDGSILNELENRLSNGGSIEDLRDELISLMRRQRSLHNDVVSLMRTLRMETAPDEVIIPKWTYVSHMAEISLAQGEFRLCGLTSDGQVDINDLAAVINKNTRAILFATVGNPLTVAMKPEIFDEILVIAQEKSIEFGHPIVVLADIIYEQFRKDRHSRIDAIQRALKLTAKVPVVEMTSFSKMLAIPGERVGAARVLWDPGFYPEQRKSFMTAMKNIQSPGLGAVACSVQRALGSMYASISTKLPVEEELVPIVALLTALSDLSKTKELPITLGDTQLLFRDKENREQNLVPKKIWAPLENVGIEKGFFSARKVTNKSRKIAAKELGLYGVDLDSEKAMAIGNVLAQAGLIDMIKRDEVVFYRLKVDVPPVDRDAKGKLQLHRISEDSAWRAIAKKCGVVTEDVLYQEHKKQMRDNTSQRVTYFAQGIDMMRREGVGVYLHPAYYDEQGNLDQDRFNAFYVLWGFEKLKKYQNNGPSQARLLAEKCEALGKPIIACVPGECFLPPELREDESSYIRSVALLPIEKLDEVLQIIGLVAREMDNGS